MRTKIGQYFTEYCRILQFLSANFDCGDILRWDWVPLFWAHKQRKPLENQAVFNFSRNFADKKRKIEIGYRCFWKRNRLRGYLAFCGELGMSIGYLAFSGATAQRRQLATEPKRATTAFKTSTSTLLVNVCFFPG
jgi:hypothetical protein